MSATIENGPLNDVPPLPPEDISKRSIEQAHRYIDRVVSWDIRHPLAHEYETIQMAQARQNARAIRTTRNDTDETPERYNQYYTLLAKAEMAPEIVTGYKIFAADHDADAARRAFNGVSAKTADILGDALRTYDKSDDPTERYEISGAIQEMTFPMMINFDEDGQRFAFPASYTDDMYKKIDMYVMHRPDHGSTARNLGFRACTQIKSVKTNDENIAPANGFCLFGDDIKNTPTRGFQTSRSLVRLYETGQLTPQESSHLELARRTLAQLLDIKLAQHPGTVIRQRFAI